MFYAIIKGKQTGVFTADIGRELIQGYTDAVYSVFDNIGEAYDWYYEKVAVNQKLVQDTDKQIKYEKLDITDVDYKYYLSSYFFKNNHTNIGITTFYNVYQNQFTTNYVYNTNKLSIEILGLHNILLNACLNNLTRIVIYTDDTTTPPILNLNWIKNWSSCVYKIDMHTMANASILKSIDNMLQKVTCSIKHIKKYKSKNEIILALNNINAYKLYQLVTKKQTTGLKKLRNLETLLHDITTEQVDKIINNHEFHQEVDTEDLEELLSEIDCDINKFEEHLNNVGHTKV